MKSHWITTLYLVFSCMAAYSQQSTFLKKYPSGNCGFAVRETGASFVLAGGTDYYYNYHFSIMSSIASTNIHLVKTDLSGSMIWQKIYANSGSRLIITWMENLPDSGMILTGRRNNDVVWPPDSNDIVLARTDVDGNILWAKKFDTGKDEIGYSVRPTNDNGFIVSAFHDAVPVSTTGSTFAVLIKTDSLGNILWEKKYSLAVRDLLTAESLPWTVRQTADGGYILVGTTASTHAADVYVIRTDGSGNLIWAKSYDHDSTALRFSLALDVVELNNGDFVIAGSMDLDQSLSQYNYPYILKINSTGTILQTKFYDSNPPETYQSGFSSVELLPDSNLLFTGNGGYGGFGFQAQILKTDQNLNMIWSRTYTNDGAATISSRSGRSTTDGGYVFTGRTVVTGTVLFKTDQQGLISCKIPGTLIEMTPSVIAINKFPSVINGINSTALPLNSLPVLADTTSICLLTNSTLPIELLSFTGKALPEYEAKLDWTTASEIENDYFILEKSNDGKQFYTAGMVKGAGSSTTLHTYSFTDKNPQNATIVYYRLKQVDYDGNSSESKTIAIIYKSQPFKIENLFIENATSQLSVTIQSSEYESVNINLTDPLGKVITLKNIDSSPGVLTYHIDLPNLPTGIYFFSATNNKERISKKILIK